MSSITDLADLIAANRARLEHTFDGEIARSTATAPSTKRCESSSRRPPAFRSE
jgi:hypothetical protein